MSSKTSVVAAALIAAATWLNPGEARAGIPIPCTGSKIVKVLNMAPPPTGEPMHVGYLFGGCLGDKFVLWPGTGRQYYQMNEQMLQLLPTLGVKAPGFWSAAWNNKATFWVEWLWAGFGLLLGGAMVKNVLLYGTVAHPSTRPAPAATAGGGAPIPARVPRALSPTAANAGGTFGRR